MIAMEPKNRSTLNMAERLVSGRLRAGIPSGTLRKANQSEAIAARCAWQTVSSLEELETHLRNHPEGCVLVEGNHPWNALVQTIHRSGAANSCRVLQAS